METRLIEGLFPSVSGIPEGEQHIVLIPVNCQGVMDMLPTDRRFKYKFPQTYKKYEADCFFGVVPGMFTVYEENGYVIYLLYVKKYVIGDQKLLETADQTVLHFNEALSGVLKHAARYEGEKELKFFSPPIPFTQAQHMILKSTIKASWNCVSKGGT